MRIKREKNAPILFGVFTKTKRYLFYQGPFWKDAIEKISNNYIKNGIENLRNFQTNNVFFVP